MTITYLPFTLQINLHQLLVTEVHQADLVERQEDRTQQVIEIKEVTHLLNMGDEALIECRIMKQRTSGIVWKETIAINTIEITIYFTYQLNINIDT